MSFGPGWLFCPADRPDRYAKAAAAADVVILDLEDAVSPPDKEAARDALIATPLDPANTFIRVNAFGTAFHEDDMKALSQTAYQQIMLPKCESPAEVAALASYEVIALIESARGAVEVASVASVENIVGLMWGAEDLVASLGGTASRRSDGSYRDAPVQVRAMTLLAAKAYGRFALDAVHLDIKDVDGLREEATDAAALGFDATVAIHPAQVPVIRAAYAPDEAEADWARRVLDAASRERGVFQFEGRMVDGPILRHAEALLRRSPA